MPEGSNSPKRPPITRSFTFASFDEFDPSHVVAADAGRSRRSPADAPAPATQGGDVSHPAAER